MATAAAALGEQRQPHKGRAYTPAWAAAQAAQRIQQQQRPHERTTTGTTDEGCGASGTTGRVRPPRTRICGGARRMT